MTLPSQYSAISLGNVQTEFGGSNPIGMNEYYAGGSYVPSGTSGDAGAVPTSGAISLHSFHGISAVPSIFYSSFSSTSPFSEAWNPSLVLWAASGGYLYLNTQDTTNTVGYDCCLREYTTEKSLAATITFSFTGYPVARYLNTQMYANGGTWPSGWTYRACSTTVKANNSSYLASGGNSDGNITCTNGIVPANATSIVWSHSKWCERVPEGSLGVLQSTFYLNYFHLTPTPF